MRRTPRDTFESVSVRNLHEIQEQDPQQRPSRLTAMVLASFGGACIVFAALALMRTPSAEKPQAADPLDALVERAAGDGTKPTPRKLDAADVTFPSVLTDQANPTTAMEVVRRSGDPDELPRQDVPGGPPPATDRLQVVPLPAQDVLEQTDASVAPSDTLRTMAQEVAREPEAASEADPGAPGGYQLQVSSFKEKAEADGFATVLRRRGHRAHVEAAHVKGRGLWHRVRIGPFKYRRSADIYRQDFEAKERIVTFVVDPPKAHIRVAPAAEDSE